IGYCHHGVFTGKECQRIVARSIKATESFSNRIIEKCRELGGMANYLPVFADEVTKDLNLSFVNIDLMEEVSKRMLESVIEAEGIKEAVS
ncbi:MAG: hypothetical protein SV375_11085, partial [Thermodesulfobacteriota bacterium]|nr:hypothetical protein [Thermodesulfobacteriota bacterium]